MAGPAADEIRRTGTAAGAHRYSTMTSPGTQDPFTSNR
jgi:hypothetical protein